MKKHIITLFFAGLLFFFTFCNHDENKFTEINSISIKSSETDFVSFFSDKPDSTITFTSIETKKECLLGDMLDAIIDKNNIYILDKHTRKKLFVFTHDGKFKFSLGKIGKGIDEYLGINDFDVEENEIIALVDKGRTYLYHYNKNDGRFLKQENAPKGITAYSMKKSDGGKSYFYNGGINKIGSNSFDIIQSSNSGEHIKGALKKSNKLPPNSEICLYKDSNTKSCYYWNPILNQVFKLSENDAKEVLELKEAEKQREFLKNNDLSKYFKEDKPLYVLSKIAISVDYQYYLVAKQSKNNVLFYHIFNNAKTKKYSVCKDIANNSPSIQSPYICDDFFFCLASPEFANRIQNNQKYDIHDNPVLLKFKID